MVSDNYDAIRLSQNAKYLRNNSTLPEILFWMKIKNRQIGYKFIRQRVIGRYIVDFYCAELKLVIEIDGRDHALKVDYDIHRENEIRKLGYEFIRFSNEQIYNNLDGCIDYLKRYIAKDPNCDTSRPW